MLRCAKLGLAVIAVAALAALVARPRRLISHYMCLMEGPAALQFCNFLCKTEQVEWEVYCNKWFDLV